MTMVKSIYLNTLNILKKLPVRLWGVSLLNGLLILIVTLFAGMPFIAIPVAAALEAGMVAVYYKAYTTGGDAESKTMFLPFKDFRTFKRIAGGMCWQKLWIFLWFIIPIAGPFLAIYKSLEYAFTPYILNEEPDVCGSDSLKKSINDTKGYKTNMFIAIVLPSVAYFVLTIILSLLALIPFVGIVFSIVETIISLAFTIVAPLFFGLVEAGFYEYGKKPLPKKAAIPAPAAPAAPAVPAAPAAPAPEPSVVVSEPAAGTICPVCGKENSAEKKFCGHCGAKL